MSVQDYFHERAEESRHNEVVAYVMFLAGSVFFVGGILSALSMNKASNWFLLFPVADLAQGLVLELLFLAVGIFLITMGIVTGLRHAKERSLYMQQLREVHNPENLLREQRLQISQPAQPASKRKKKSK